MARENVRRIRELDPHVADLIAAGEVVERPASVVKELVENAVDAGATRISVDIKRGGMAFIRVSDDGGGIDPEDLPTAFLRHATSKVSTAADLDGIATMGFRGEALASIAAVARVSVVTRQRGSVEGASYSIAGGVGGSVEPAGCPEGTSVTVEELFYNTPARMKFLKRDANEGAKVASVVASAALAYPEIAFRFTQDGELELSTRGSGDTASTVTDVLGSSFAAGLLEVHNIQNGIKVHGFVSKPMFGRGNRTKQEFFVNRRPVKSRMLSAALEQGYKNRMVQGRFPACVIYIELSPAAVDVNVHPAKSEVKFAFEREVFDAVYLAVASGLEEGDVRSRIGRAAPQFEPDKPGEQQSIGRSTGFVRTETPPLRGSVSNYKPNTSRPSAPPEPKAPSDPRYKGETEAKQVAEFYRRMREEISRELDENPAEPYEKGDGKLEFHEPQENGGEIEIVGARIEKPTETTDIPVETIENVPTEQPSAEPPALPEWRILGEVFGTYILVEDADELVFIDKHAAHERIIFDRLVAAGEKPLVQYLITPLVLNFTRDEASVLLENLDTVNGLGFEIDHFGGESFAVRALPSEIERDDAQPVLEQIADDLRSHRRVDMLERREELLRLIACKAAIKANSKTSDAERRALVERVMGYRDVKFCPHGRPVAAVLDRAELERRINRRV